MNGHAVQHCPSTTREDALGNMVRPVVNGGHHRVLQSFKPHGQAPHYT